MKSRFNGDNKGLVGVGGGVWGWCRVKIWSVQLVKLPLLTRSKGRVVGLHEVFVGFQLSDVRPVVSHLEGFFSGVEATTHSFGFLGYETVGFVSFLSSFSSL